MTWTRRVVGTIAVLAAAIGGVVMVRRASLRWGATIEESQLSLAGDHLLSVADLMATRAISIAATPAEVWPWLAQLGQNRGGFYTYDWLENLVGVEIHSAASVEQQLQIRAVGEDVNLAPGVALTVVQFDEGRELVLRGAVGLDGTAAGAPYDFTWDFVVRPRPDGSTRLIVRERYTYLRSWAGLLVEPLEMISFFMTERMLRGIRQRAEEAS
jgi:hypothetical protein